MPNKVTTDLKDMVLKALNGAGGVEYLIERANDPKTASAFLSLVGKVLPLQITGADGGALVIQHVERRLVEHAPLVVDVEPTRVHTEH